MFICDVFLKNPRYKSKYILAGQSRGLFRINKETLEANLLLPIDGDKNGSPKTQVLQAPAGGRCGGFCPFARENP